MYEHHIRHYQNYLDELDSFDLIFPFGVFSYRNFSKQERIEPFNSLTWPVSTHLNYTIIKLPNQNDCTRIDTDDGQVQTTMVENP